MKEITEKEFNTLRTYIKDTFGISLGNEKKSLIYSRLRTVLQELGMDNFTDYYKYLVGDKSGQAAIKFIDKVTTNHTFFMRETDHFDFFRDKALPYVEETYTNNDLRLWCAGCSSGEESYTLKFIIEDHFSKCKAKWNTEILATDISTQVLDKAIHGVYPNDSVETLPDAWRKKYFDTFDGTHKIVKQEIKNSITYRKFNLMMDKFPFKKPFQIIFCRNVMIYFDNETRDTLVKKFYDLTEPGGYLFIGHSESLNHTDTKYKYVMPALYRKER
jgi:chemotaxis protein methyltransferase CheR